MHFLKVNILMPQIKLWISKYDMKKTCNDDKTITKSNTCILIFLSLSIKVNKFSNKIQRLERIKFSEDNYLVWYCFAKIKIY